MRVVNGLYAAFNTKTGEVLGKTAVRYTSAEFVAFLTDIVLNQPRGKEIHVIADNSLRTRPGRSKSFSPLTRMPGMVLLVEMPLQSDMADESTACEGESPIRA
jgi:hypothetical protein